MENTANPPRMSVSKILIVLVGFPIVSTLISLLLINRNIFVWTGLDFFSIFWTIIICWYLTQIFIISKILKSSGWTWNNIGYTFNKKQTVYFILGYLIFAFAVFGFIEFVLANSTINTEKLNALSDLANLTPTTTLSRISFIFLALVAGLCEEFIYRGFAIRVLENYKINKWVTIIIAAIPFVFQHGLKSLDQFWWFFGWALAFGVLFLLTKKLYINIIIHWLLILSAMLAILQVVE